MFSGERVLVPILDQLYARLGAAQSVVERRGRPMFTVAYAQSLDGSIAGERNRPIELSCDHSWQLTHELRAAHDAILVGIGTVIADNPRLTVRLVPGTDPRPIVVDSCLRIPRGSHLLNENRQPWVATTEAAGGEAEAALRSRGADVLRLPALGNGWVNLEALARCLAEVGVSHVLVEGGARILTSFLKARLVDYVVVTVSPQFVGGVAALTRNELSPFPRLRSWRTERLGDDLVVAGELAFADE